MPLLPQGHLGPDLLGPDWDEAEATFDNVLRSLVELRYEPVIVPKSDVAARAAFVLERTT